MIVGISGKAQSGKDTLAEGILATRPGFRLALADPLKLDCLAYFRLPVGEMWGPKTIISRTVLQGYGSVKRDDNPDYWIKTLFSSPLFLSLMSTSLDIFITDVRYLNEMQWIGNSGGMLWRLKRPGFGAEVPNHPSETFQEDIDDTYFDQVIPNTGSIQELIATGTDILDSDWCKAFRDRQKVFSEERYTQLKTAMVDGNANYLSVTARELFGLKEDPLC